MSERGIAIIDDDAASSIPVDVTPVVVDLTIGDHDDLGRRGLSVTERCERLVERCDVVGAQRVVMMSSAMVYGAHRTNAVPLTEDAVMRPDTEFVFARQLAAAEATLDRWRNAAPERVVAVLRPAIVAGGSGA